MREFLASIPSRKLGGYAEECLSESFKDSGFALQDVVNEIGARLGFKVKSGRYRGTPTTVGFDGLWGSPEKHQII